MSVQNARVREIVQTIVGSVLGLACEPSAAMPGKSFDAMASCVEITGAWQGAIVFGCPEAFAARAAAIMFDAPPAGLCATDLHDAIAELTNMIGGNVKGLLATADECHLSLPSVIAGGDYTTRVPGSSPLIRIALDCGGQTLVVIVLEKSFAAQAA